MERISSYFMVGASGLDANGFKEFVKEYPVASVILFKRNFENREQLIELNKLLKEAKSDLLIAVDHEGGRVQRFKDGFKKLPSFREQVLNLSHKELFELHLEISKDLKSVGIDINLTPVADMTNEVGGVIGDRSIGTDLDLVERGISATIRGMDKGGIISCIKHFPGHGSSNVDSHEELPVVNRTLEELCDYEIRPFKKAARSRVASIMLAHILYPQIDTVPASLSKIFIDKIRENLSFDKPILTDDFTMKAIQNKYGVEEASLMAIEAGVDMIIYSENDYNKLANLFDSLNKKIENNSSLKERMFNQRVFR